MDLKSRTPMMALDTACRHHPGAIFELYVQQNTSAYVDPSVVKAMKKAKCNLEVKPLDPESFFDGTPFERFARANMSTLLAGRFNKTMLSDLFRATVLWQNGGWYLDSDVVVLKPLTRLKNVMGIQGGRYVNGAVMHLPKHSSFVDALAREAAAGRWAASRRCESFIEPLESAQALIQTATRAWARAC